MTDLSGTIPIQLATDKIRPDHLYSSFIGIALRKIAEKTGIFIQMNIHQETNYDYSIDWWFTDTRIQKKEEFKDDESGYFAW